MSDEKLSPEELPIELQPDFFDDDFETPDISEFLDSVSKRFCPECGKPVADSDFGRQRVFCSDDCRKAYWKKHKRFEDWESYEKLTCPVCGRIFYGRKDQHRKYCSHACAFEDTWKRIHEQDETAKGDTDGENNYCSDNDGTDE